MLLKRIKSPLFKYVVFKMLYSNIYEEAQLKYSIASILIQRKCSLDKIEFINNECKENNLRNNKGF